jgi:hypothetical protein
MYINVDHLIPMIYVFAHRVFWKAVSKGGKAVTYNRVCGDVEFPTITAHFMTASE